MAGQKADPIVRMGGPRGGNNSRYMGEKPKNGGETLKRLLREFYPEKRMIFLLFAVVAAGCASAVIAPGFQASAIDQLSSLERRNLLRYLVLMFGAYLVFGVCSLLQGQIAAHLSQRVVKRMSRDLFE